MIFGFDSTSLNTSRICSHHDKVHGISLIVEIWFVQSSLSQFQNSISSSGYFKLQGNPHKNVLTSYFLPLPHSRPLYSTTTFWNENINNCWCAASSKSTDIAFLYSEYVFWTRAFQPWFPYICFNNNLTKAFYGGEAKHFQCYIQWHAMCNDYGLQAGCRSEIQL